METNIFRYFFIARKEDSMVKGLYTAYTGMVEEQRRLDVLSNNLANSDTVGFKKEGTVNQAFRNMLAIKIKDTGTYMMNYGIGDIRLGDKVGETYVDWSQGSFEVTDVQSDVALAGRGFFAVSHVNNDGTRAIRYTRDGAFTVDVNGYLRTSDGDYVLNRFGATNSIDNEGNYVRINPLRKYAIATNGDIYQDNVIVGNIGVVDFVNYDVLTKTADNLIIPVQGAQMQASEATLQQGMLEAANVNVIDEMVNMITIQRAYEAGQKMIQTVDSTLEHAVNNVGRV
jgi:flagellar basal-body rod protein FlgG